MYLSVDGQELPGEDPNLLDGNSVLPGVDVLVPPAADRFTVGAYVQARKIAVTGVVERPSTVVSEFTVTAVSGDTVTGSLLGVLTGSAGWEFEVIRPAPLDLPTEARTTIQVELADGRAVELTGKGEVWMDAAGDLVDVKKIRRVGKPGKVAAAAKGTKR